MRCSLLVSTDAEAMGKDFCAALVGILRRVSCPFDPLFTVDDLMITACNHTTLPPCVDELGTSSQQSV